MVIRSEGESAQLFILNFNLKAPSVFVNDNFDLLKAF